MATTAPSELEPKLIPAAPSESESLLSSLVFDTSQQFQIAMSNMLKMITEIDQTAGGIMEEIGKCKDTAFERKKDRRKRSKGFRKLLTLCLACSMTHNKNGISWTFLLICCHYETGSGRHYRSGICILGSCSPNKVKFYFKPYA